MVERLVGIDRLQDGGKTKGVVVDQEESDNGGLFSYLCLLERKSDFAKPGIMDVYMVEEVVVEEKKHLVHRVICPNPL